MHWTFLTGSTVAALRRLQRIGIECYSPMRTGFPLPIKACHPRRLLPESSPSQTFSLAYPNLQVPLTPRVLQQSSRCPLCATFEILKHLRHHGQIRSGYPNQKGFEIKLVFGLPWVSFFFFPVFAAMSALFRTDGSEGS